MRFLAPALILLPLLLSNSSLASTQFETLKTMDGGVLYCESKKDLGQVGFRLEETLVDVSSKAADTLDFTFGPNFYKCVQGANGPEWQTSDINAFLYREVQTPQGLVKIVPVSYKWVVYAENYKELNPDPSIQTKNLGSTYSVTISDLLSGSENKGRRNRSMSQRGIVTVFLRSVQKIVYPDGREENMGYRASSSFNIVITLPSN